MNYHELPKQGLHDTVAPRGVNEKSSAKMAFGKKEGASSDIKRGSFAGAMEKAGEMSGE
jgi:hypothetical protein